MIILGFVGLGVRKIFDLNLSSSHCSTSYALKNENMDTLHYAWLSLDNNNYTSSDSINSCVHIARDSTNHNSQ